MQRMLIVSLEMFQKGQVPEIVKKYLDSCEKEPFIILDESSRIKTNTPVKDDTCKSQRTQSILRLNNIGERCILTGTFMSTSPMNAYDQVKFLQDDFFTEGMYEFSEKYEIKMNLPLKRKTVRALITPEVYRRVRNKLAACKNDVTKLAGAMDYAYRSYGISKDSCVAIIKSPDFTTRKNIDKLWKRLEGLIYRFTKDQVVDLPPKVYSEIKIQLSEEQKKLYLQLQNLHCTDNVVVGNNALTLYHRFQDICNGFEPVEEPEVEENKEVTTEVTEEEITEVEENKEVSKKIVLKKLKENPKLNALLEVIEQIGNEQAVIWCSRSSLLYEIFNTLQTKGYKVGVYDGKVNRNQRDEYYNGFKNKTVQFLIANQASASYGLDGLKDANYAIYVCNSYSSELRAQSEDRIYRGEIKNSKFIIDITMEGTCEQKVMHALKEGKELINSGAVDTTLFMYEGE